MFTSLPEWMNNTIKLHADTKCNVIHHNVANLIRESSFFFYIYMLIFKKELRVREFLTSRYLWKSDSATCGQRRRCRHRGRDSAAPPPPRLIWKRKKNFFCIEGINSRHLVVARN